MTDTTSRRRKKLRPPLSAELTLEDWGPKGYTVADLEGRRVLVDRGIPGERVEAELDRRRNPWRGPAMKVLEPAPARTSPPCPYYLEGCGGCQWQHIEYGTQLDTKRMLVDRELQRAGVVVEVLRTHAMEEPWRYRRTAAIAIGWEAGFRPRGRRGIVEIHDCPISHPLIGRLADRLNTLLRRHQLPNYHGRVWLDCTVVGSEAEPRLQVMLQGIGGITPESHPEIVEVAERIGDIEEVEAVAFRHRSGEPVPVVGDLMSLIEVAGRDMYLPAGSFFQTNLRMVSRVLRRMREELLGRAVREAADVYGGVGTFGLPLASEIARVTLVELDPVAVEAARRTAGRWQLTNVDFVSQHAERALPELPALDLVVVDPPRSGLGESVVRSIIENSPPLVFYVSCAPPSLADDLAALTQGGYRVRSLELFDFYPQTYHVESFAVLER